MAVLQFRLEFSGKPKYLFSHLLMAHVFNRHRDLTPGASFLAWPHLFVLFLHREYCTVYHIYHIYNVYIFSIELHVHYILYCNSISPYTLYTALLGN